MFIRFSSLEVVMLFTYGLILHCLLCVLLVHHLHSHFNK
jgi:hypothetical protein